LFDLIDFHAPLHFVTPVTTITFVWQKDIILF